MSDLDDLKNTWFIPMDGSTIEGVPCQRGTDGGADALSVSTDGNTVTPQIDGQTYMGLWHNNLLGLKGQPGAELQHAAWRLEPVKTLGASAPGNDALEDIHDADTASVATHVDICGNPLALKFNVPSYHTLRDIDGVAGACMDQRFPATGSNHQKFAIFKTDTSASAMTGSIDISKSRWDTTAHLLVNADRDAKLGQATHDTGVLVEGPAVGDIEKTFRERWNDPTRTNLQFPPVPPPITSPVAAFPSNGTHSVQVLRTYGIEQAANAYSWSPRGEFTVWASYLNAIKKAKTYIYIEDQYFYPFGWPPCYARANGSPAQRTDLVFQLGQAILNNGVQVVILVPTRGEDSVYIYQTYQRNLGVNYLMDIAAQAQSQTPAQGTQGDLVVASLQKDTGDVMVHSKLMIVDDKFVLIGSANVGQRSMTMDSELHLGIVDPDDVFALDLRKNLWAEHSGRTFADIPDVPAQAFTQIKADVAGKVGRLKPYEPDKNAVYPPVSGSTSPPFGHTTIMPGLIDPYCGPPSLR